VRRRSLARRLAVVAAVVGSVLTAGPGATGAAATATSTSPGTFEITGPLTEGCPVGFTCSTVAVSCAAPYDAVPPITGSVAIGRYAGPRRGTLVTFGGGGGQDFWMAGRAGKRARRPIAEAGIEVVAVAWDRSWNQGTQGLAALSCRPATAIAWAAERDAALGSVPPPGDGVCGVCVVGYSIGSSQATMAVAFNDIADVVDAVVAVAGPATADIGAGCRRDGTPLQYMEPETNPVRVRIDDSFDDGDPSVGPCSALPADLTAAPAWDANSLVHAGRVSFPTTRFHFVWGSQDRTGAVGQGITELAALSAGGSPLLAYRCIVAHHDVFELRAGVLAIVDAVLWDPADGLFVPPAPEPAMTPRCVPN
jgi:hypothetical protein